MKTMLLAAFAVLALSAGAAAAPGHAATAMTKGYGQAWAEIHRDKDPSLNNRSRSATLGVSDTPCSRRCGSAHRSGYLGSGPYLPSPDYARWSAGLTQPTD